MSLLALVLVWVAVGVSVLLVLILFLILFIAGYNVNRIKYNQYDTITISSKHIWVKSFDSKLNAETSFEALLHSYWCHSRFMFLRLSAQEKHRGFYFLVLRSKLEKPKYSLLLANITELGKLESI